MNREWEKNDNSHFFLLETFTHGNYTITCSWRITVSAWKYMHWEILDYSNFDIEWFEVQIIKCVFCWRLHCHFFPVVSHASKLSMMKRPWIWLLYQVEENFLCRLMTYFYRVCFFTKYSHYCDRTISRHL